MSRGTIPILRVGDNLLVTVQSDLHDAVAEAFQDDLLTTIEKSGAAGLLIDISGLDTVDSYVARVLADTGRMAKLMGTSTVIVGMRPEVAATLVRMGYVMAGVKTALNVDEGLIYLAGGPDPAAPGGGRSGAEPPERGAEVPRVVSRVEMKVDAEDDVVVVRRRVRALAQERGFDAFATAAVTTAASELARNVIVHARRGQAVVEELFYEGRTGIRLTLQDEGPGITDLTRALAGGYSTARSLGLGLSGSKRLVDEFHIETTPGVGTLVRVVKWARY